MADDKGARSVEVNIYNGTTATFTIQGVSLNGDGTEWIKSETPQQGDSLPLYNSKRYGAMNTNFNSQAGGQIVLTGFGDPFPVQFNNDEQGNSTCSCPGNSKVSAVIHQVNTGEENHSQFNVNLGSA